MVQIAILLYPPSTLHEPRAKSASEVSYVDKLPPEPHNPRLSDRCWLGRTAHHPINSDKPFDNDTARNSFNCLRSYLSQEFSPCLPSQSSTSLSSRPSRRYVRRFGARGTQPRLAQSARIRTQNTDPYCFPPTVLQGCLDYSRS